MRPARSVTPGDARISVDGVDHLLVYRARCCSPILGDPIKPVTTWQDKLDELHGLIRTMKQEQRRLVSENALLLQRALTAEAEAHRHQRHNARLIAERDTALRAVPATTKARRTVSPDNKTRN